MTVESPRSELDGMVITYLPNGIGDQVSDFAFEWGDVAFRQRVWESRVDDGWRVDLQIAVLRGDRLADLDALHAFLVEYHEYPPPWGPDDFRHGPWRGFGTDRAVSWLVERGWAAEVRNPSDRLSRAELEVTALGVVPDPAREDRPPG